MWEHVRVVGFGHISPIPRVWTAIGIVNNLETAPDGTPILILKFSSPARPGNSGSPVLNDQSEVIGMWAWYSPTDPTDGAGISSTALTPACRSRAVPLSRRDSSEGGGVRPPLAERRPVSPRKSAAPRWPCQRSLRADPRLPQP
jgi:hypothetical protein